MQLQDIVRPLEDLTTEELLTRIREVRQRRETVRPAATVRAERSERKATRAKVSGIEKLLLSMSEEERTKFIEQLSNTTGADNG